MAEPFPPAFLLESPPLVAVKVINVSPLGEIEMIPATNDSLSRPFSRYVKLPIPNPEAYQLVYSTLLGETFSWMQKPQEAVQYNIFLDSVGNNVTYSLYMAIVDMLNNPIGLPEATRTGTCRISPIHDPEQLYVQPQPGYVDTVSYVTCVALYDKLYRGVIEPAEDVVIGEIYIFADGVRNYRVKLLERIVTSEPTWYKDLRSIFCRVRETTESTGSAPVGEHENGRVGFCMVCGSEHGYRNISFLEVFKELSDGWGENNKEESEGDRDTFDRIWCEEEVVFRIDYGGPPIRVHRAFLYTVDSVCQALRYIPQLAFPVTVEYINGSVENKDARIEELRTRRQIINITTVFEGTSDTPALVDISH